MEIEEHFNGFYKDKRIFLTGHTGFKGSWLSLFLHKLGADVTGFSLVDPPTEPSMFEILGLNDLIVDIRGDINDFKSLHKNLTNSNPEIVIHMAAQSLVLDSYEDPLNTYSTNVLGTANVLESVRRYRELDSLLIITSDKCYYNKEEHVSFSESDRLGGLDPYSSSKSCAEIVTNAYRHSFFKDKLSKTAISTARAGNVIGGGDWAKNRLLPDCIRALHAREKITIRNPHYVRPWQHVMDPLYGYLKLVTQMSNDSSNFTGAWNFGPDKYESKNVEWVVEEVCKRWGTPSSWVLTDNSKHKESTYLALDSSKAKEKLNFSAKWNVSRALEMTIDWYKRILVNGEDAKKVTYDQISSYLTDQ